VHVWAAKSETLSFSVLQLSPPVNPVIMECEEKNLRLCWVSVHSQKEKCKHEHLPLISTVDLGLMQNCVPVGLAKQVACHCRIIIVLNLEFLFIFRFSLSF